MSAGGHDNHSRKLGLDYTAGGQRTRGLLLENRLGTQQGVARAAPDYGFLRVQRIRFQYDVQAQSLGPTNSNREVSSTSSMSERIAR